MQLQERLTPLPAPHRHVSTLLGAALEVHRQLGPGCLELLYQEALAMEFRLRDIPFQREVHVPMHYKGQKLSLAFRADFVCYSTLVMEIKAVQALMRKDDAQLLSYLKATGHAHGLLLNFGPRGLQFKRLGPGFAEEPGPEHL